MLREGETRAVAGTLRGRDDVEAHLQPVPVHLPWRPSGIAPQRPQALVERGAGNPHRAKVIAETAEERRIEFVEARHVRRGESARERVPEGRAHVERAVRLRRR